MGQRRRYALVGTGARAAMYVDAIAGPYRDAAELVGLCDLSQTRMNWHNRRLGTATGMAPRPTYRADRFDAMVAETRPDTVIVTTVDATHQYVFFTKLNLVNTFYPLLLPRFFGMAFFIFMIMQFIRGIPKELDEAAEIDGCSHFGIFFRIILPLIRPALITAAIFSFYWTWEDFLTPLVYLNEPKLYTISVALRSFADASGATDWGAIFAMSALSLVPVLVVFVVFQRYLVQGISTTGMKG